MRKIHYVGSLPDDVTRRGPYLAMDWAIGTARAWPPGSKVNDAALGGKNAVAELTGVPCDLDTRWIIDYLDSLAGRHCFRAIRQGGSGDYDTMPIHRVHRGCVLTPREVSMDRLDKLKSVITAYRNLAENVGVELPPLRISLPNPLDLALFVFVGKVDLKRHPIRTLRGSWLALRNLKHFLDAMVTEVREIQRYADPERTAARDQVADVFDIPEHMLGSAEPSAEATPIVWQFETPGVLYALNLVPRFLRPMLARLLATQVANALGLIWNVRQELHLCYGDLGHKNIATPTSAQEMVEFLNPLADQLADLPPVHLPFAYGDHAPSTDPGFYEPLEGLSEDWKIYAGVVDENDSQASREALYLVELHSGRTAEAVACACGLGRRDTDAARKAVDAMVMLTNADRADQDEDEEKIEL